MKLLEVLSSWALEKFFSALWERVKSRFQTKKKSQKNKLHLQYYRENLAEEEGLAELVKIIDRGVSWHKHASNPAEAREFVRQAEAAFDLLLQKCHRFSPQTQSSLKSQAERWFVKYNLEDPSPLRIKLINC